MANATAFNFVIPQFRFTPISHNFSNEDNSKEISMEEVSWHDNANDCWVVIYDRVYDVTNFIDEHPGGDEVLMEHAGRDATMAFRGAEHGSKALQSLSKYMIGELPINERLFRKPGGIKLSDIPE
ncbi:cytochrome b5 [Rhynchophorus ferrugineus]|uniref:Cytochrome b5 heme-binding domain-containing protein n=1 Tax=Rhynchophorus ferrugineus TaxID=354439 RepID=A0A834IIC9_RHYFE|nr:hypothetical protein GWI33_004843 [Rhynchophorus ferrugineus]